MTMHSEDARQWVHIGSGLFALLLRVLTWREAAMLAATAAAFNIFVLPRIGGRRLYRPADHARGFPLGIVIYPLAVLLLILVFSARLDIAAAAWGILACGDGAATIVGRRARRRLPWNPQKSVAGTLAFAVSAAVAGVTLAWWTRPDGSLWFTVLAPLAAAVAAALVESIPVRLDDNISVPLTAGVVLWIASVMTAESLAAARPAIVAALPWAIGLNVLVAWGGFKARTVSVSGAVSGAITGALIYLGGGPGAWTLLLVTFLLASTTSRLGLQRKIMLGIAEGRGGRRGSGNVIANCGVAAVAAIAAVTTPYATEALIALAAALAAGGSDTVASEVGKSYGRSTFLITTLRRVKPGTSGAMSLEGTAAGLIAALSLGAIAASLGLVAGALVLVIVVAATAGAAIESVLGATVEGAGILNNDMLNFINTAVSAVVALVLW